MQQQILTLLTRTPLHIGAGSSVGAIDQPIVRERHTRFPVIPGTSLKGVLADLWPANDQGRRDGDAIWLFGSEDASAASAGALLIGEGKLLTFPVRSAKGAFAWITCPLALARFSRDTGNDGLVFSTSLKGEECHAPATLQPSQTEKKIILEEYVVEVKGEVHPTVTDALAKLTDDAVWQQLKEKLAIVSDELFAYFAENACETAQHIRIDDETGTVAGGALFNQENVPSETLFYAVLNAQDEKGKDKPNRRLAKEALTALDAKLKSPDVNHLLQLGADETTGLGWCSVTLRPAAGKTE